MSKNKTPINTYSLDELGSVGRGRSRYRPRNSPHLYGGDYPFVQTADVKSADLYITNYTQTYNDIGLAQSKLWDAGTLCITIAANIADTAILSFPACFPDSVIGFIPDKNKSDVKYIKYYFDLFQRVFKQISQGAAQDNLSAKKLLGLKIPAPPLPTQQKIAQILSAYDDLIENNLKRIKLLEEMAQITYEQWFVRMKFPNHETTPIDTETGLPEGWCFLPLNQSIHVNPTTKPEKGTKAPFVPMGSLSTNSMTITNIEERIPSGGAKFINGDTLVARITPCLENGKTGYVNFLGKDIVATGSTEFIVLRSTGLTNKYFIYCVSRSELFRELSIRSMAGSDGRQRVNPKVYSKMLLAIPTKKLIDKFEDITQPMFDTIHSLVSQNIRLKEARDILLPRLMTGIIDVDKIKLPKPLDKNTHTAPANIKEAIPSE